MIISRQYAEALIRDGAAAVIYGKWGNKKEVTIDGKPHVAVRRNDKDGREDHYPAE